MLVTLIITAVDAHARATSCIASAYATAPAASRRAPRATLIAMQPEVREALRMVAGELAQSRRLRLLGGR